MAVIEVKLDTQQKILEASIDGKKVDNVSEVVFYGYNENKGSVEFRTVEMEQEESYMKITTIYANEQNEDVITEQKQSDLDTAELSELLFHRSYEIKV